jgi:hypothetical protein
MIISAPMNRVTWIGDQKLVTMIKYLEIQTNTCQLIVITVSNYEMHIIC